MLLPAHVLLCGYLTNCSCKLSLNAGMCACKYAESDIYYTSHVCSYDGVNLIEKEYAVPLSLRKEGNRKRRIRWLHHKHKRVKYMQNKELLSIKYCTNAISLCLWNMLSCFLLSNKTMKSFLILLNWGHFNQQTNEVKQSQQYSSFYFSLLYCLPANWLTGWLAWASLWQEEEEEEANGSPRKGSTKENWYWPIKSLSHSVTIMLCNLHRGRQVFDF